MVAQGRTARTPLWRPPSPTPRVFVGICRGMPVGGTGTLSQGLGPAGVFTDAVQRVSVSKCNMHRDNGLPLVAVVWVRCITSDPRPSNVKKSCQWHPGGARRALPIWEPTGQKRQESQRWVFWYLVVSASLLAVVAVSVSKPPALSFPQGFAFPPCRLCTWLTRSQPRGLAAERLPEP